RRHTRFSRDWSSDVCSSDLDEVNLQRAPRPTEQLTPRKIWPPRDEGIHVVAQQDGAKIGIKGMTLKVTGKDGVTIKEIPLANLEIGRASCREGGETAAVTRA